MTHPATLLRNLGVAETPAAIAIVFVVLLQYIFLARLWLGYLIEWDGDMVSRPVVDVGLALTAVGAVFLLFSALRGFLTGRTAAKKLEHPAKDNSFAPIRGAVQRLARRSTLAEPPELLYTPKNAYALESREYAGVKNAIVVGLSQRGEQNRHPAAFDAMVGHEVSHLELRQTNIEIGVRLAAKIHFGILAWSTLIFFLAIGFIDKRGLGSSPSFGGFNPIFDLDIYAKLTAQLAVLLLSSLVVFVYSFFFLVRREHIHDLRGSQLAGNDALATQVFASPTNETSVLRGVMDFFSLHPGPSARRQVVKKHDFILLSAILYPLIIAQILPLAQLLTAGWQAEFNFDEGIWNLIDTVLTGSLLFMAVAADVSRLGLGALVAAGNWLRVPLYAVVAGAATQIPRLVLEVIFGIRHGWPTQEIFERFLQESIKGGFHIALLVSALVAALAFLASVRIAAGGGGKLATRVVQTGAEIFLAVGAFTIVSLQSSEFVEYTIVILAVVVAFHLSVSCFLNHCTECGRLRVKALFLGSKCTCGHDQLLLMKKYRSTSYQLQIETMGNC